MCVLADWKLYARVICVDIEQTLTGLIPFIIIYVVVVAILFIAYYVLHTHAKFFMDVISKK